jgi:hypothetical protein
MTTEKELRETVNSYGYGFQLGVHQKFDTLNLYPSKRSGIHKIALKLRCHIDKVALGELLQWSLTNDEFSDWNGKQWSEFL